MIDLKFVCEDEKYIPKYANYNDACMDLKVKIDEGKTSLLPHEIKCFDTGVKFNIPVGYSMEVFVRSSTGCKLNCQLANSTGIIDEGYKENIKIFLYNFGDKEVEFIDGQRVAQFRLVKDNKINLIQVKDDEEFNQGDRHGGFGSTNLI